MTRRATAVIAAAMAAVWTDGCGPRRVPMAPLPASPELIVLLGDPDGGAIGRASVATQSGTVDLIGDRSATRVSAGRPPAPPTVMEQSEVQRVFADALAALPLPPALFNLYFKAGSDELTDESRAFLATIVQAVAARPAPDVVVLGHTDTTGSPQANFDLGLLRARAIRNVLLEAGLPASLVDISSHGEADLLVPTPDETPDPRNRRVEIVIR